MNVRNYGMRKILLITLFLASSILVTKAQDATCVDLGLSVKWANCNLGAKSPEQYGDYYAWGEIKTKSKYDWTTYKWCEGTFKTLTKYCFHNVRHFGIVDNKIVLDPEDDVAYIKLGKGWRMPTKEEFDELIINCTREFSMINGINGFKFTSKINGNSIFLPAAGNYYCEYLWNAGDQGSYLSSTLDTLASHSAKGMCFILHDQITTYSDKGLMNMENYLIDGNPFRCTGNSVRPVMDK